MTKTKLSITISCLLLLFLSSRLQSQTIILPNAYAHNDYWHKRPLLDALENGFTYVEADIYLRNDELVVAHALPGLKPTKTLEKLYLQPLAAYVQDCCDKEYMLGLHPITLMIDIKSDAEKTFTALESLLESYKYLLSSYSDGKFVSRYVTIVVTGHKPFDLIKAKPERFVFLDEDLRRIGSDSSVFVYPIASCRYSKILNWAGDGPIPASEKAKLVKYVIKAHLAGRKVRLWAMPENKNVWRELLKCEVDLINTDRLTELRDFLITDVKLFTMINHQSAVVN